MHGNNFIELAPGRLLTKTGVEGHYAIKGTRNSNAQEEAAAAEERYLESLQCRGIMHKKTKDFVAAIDDLAGQVCDRALQSPATVNAAYQVGGGSYMGRPWVGPCIGWVGCRWLGTDQQALTGLLVLRPGSV
jgi:hypothetical protein